MTYVYRTRNNPPTESRQSIIDACEDAIRQGALIKVIQRAIKTDDFLVWTDYIVIEKVTSQCGDKINHRYISEEKS